MESKTVIPESLDSEEAQDFVMRAVEQPPDAFCLTVLAAWAAQDEFRIEWWFCFPDWPKDKHQVSFESRRHPVSVYEDMIRPVYLWKGKVTDFEWRKREQYDHNASIFAGVLTVETYHQDWCDPKIPAGGIKLFDGRGWKYHPCLRHLYTEMADGK